MIATQFANARLMQTAMSTTNVARSSVKVSAIFKKTTAPAKVCLFDR
jgi:hypothetical protein